MSGTNLEFLESSKYEIAGMRGAHSYLLPVLMRICRDCGPGTRVLDVGCGNGSIAAEFAKRGCTVVGIDMAEAGIRIARQYCPAGRFEVLPANQDVLARLGEAPFDIVYSLEVVEHLYDPRNFLLGCFAATRPAGRFICSTPYHGYFKNFVIGLFNGWDKHHNPTGDGGHIKFFSRKTLSSLLTETSFRDLKFHGSGRAPYIWKSMIIEARKP